MNCKNCIYCVQVKRNEYYVICRNKELLRKLDLHDDYERLCEPKYCVFYTTKKEYIKQEINKLWMNN